MRIRLIFPAALLLCCASWPPAMAQVSVDPRALEPLQKQAPVKPQSQPKPPAKPVSKPAPAAKPAAGSTVRTTPGGVGQTNAGQPAVPLAAPPAITLPPPIVVPTRPLQPAAPATVTADAPGSTTPLPAGLRVTFGAGRSDINPGMEAAIRALARPAGSASASAGTSPGTSPAASSGAAGSSYSITSFAAGTPEDPSTARRLSLSRALSVRSVLISQGIASVRIYVRALGPASAGFADGPADRADIEISGNPIAVPAAAKPR